MGEKNTGIEYEKLIQEIYTQILKQEDARNVDVKQNIIIKGKTAEHQIDVYWEFEIAGVTYKTIVQAKDWNTTVKQSDIFSFATVLQDIPGQPRGIYITRTGYQKGAKEFAEAHGIILYELREPTERDWDGKLRNIDLNIVAKIPVIGKVAILVDKEWIYENGISPNLSLLPSGLTSGDVALYDEKQAEVTTIGDIIKHYLKDTNDTEEHHINHIFDIPMFIKENNGNQFLKLKALDFEFHYQQSKYKHQIIGDDIIKYILKNTTSNDIRTIGNNLMPLSN